MTPLSKPTARNINPISMLLAVFLMVVIASACGSRDEASSDSNSVGGVRVAAPGDAADMLDASRPKPVLLDVRTPEEFNEAHLDGAILIDFYQDDFTDSLAELDRDVSYVIYCRSGNRSGQTREIMADLGFRNVVDIDGGIIAWQAHGLPTVR